MNYKTFIFSPFQENTYLLYDDSKECVIVDPGNFYPQENQTLDAFITENNLKPVYIIQTHNHLDHLFGTQYLADKYQIPLACHADEVFWIENFKKTCAGYGLAIETQPPLPSTFLTDGMVFIFGNTQLKVIHVPGHSAGGVAFYNAVDGLLFCGDILFNDSIGRADLPGGDYDQLIDGIKTKLLVLPEETKVFSGHGPATTIGKEKKSNPFLR
ncbi:MAG: MBL fold metallo-hydrolase [Salinivirgaceae bacterium]|jgi:glyoxylase-like metal-dependent hydrolase (beta-lactamase superfamily II)